MRNDNHLLQTVNLDKKATFFNRNASSKQFLSISCYYIILSKLLHLEYL